MNNLSSQVLVNSGKSGDGGQEDYKGLREETHLVDLGVSRELSTTLEI
jgi:hypothetical protein